MLLPAATVYSKLDMPLQQTYFYLCAHRLASKHSSKFQTHPFSKQAWRMQEGSSRAPVASSSLSLAMKTPQPVSFSRVLARTTPQTDPITLLSTQVRCFPLFRVRVDGLDCKHWDENLNSANDSLPFPCYGLRVSMPLPTTQRTRQSQPSRRHLRT